MKCIIQKYSLFLLFLCLEIDVLKGLFRTQVSDLNLMNLLLANVFGPADYKV